MLLCGLDIQSIKNSNTIAKVIPSAETTTLLPRKMLSFPISFLKKYICQSALSRGRGLRTMRVYVHFEEEEPCYTAALTAGCDSLCHAIFNSTSLVPLMLVQDAAGQTPLSTTSSGTFCADTSNTMASASFVILTIYQTDKRVILNMQNTSPLAGEGAAELTADAVDLRNSKSAPFTRTPSQQRQRAPVHLLRASRISPCHIPFSQISHSCLSCAPQRMLSTS